MSYESVMPVAEHPGLAESMSIGIGPDQIEPDPLIVIKRPSHTRQALDAQDDNDV